MAKPMFRFEGKIGFFAICDPREMREMIHNLSGIDKNILKFLLERIWEFSIRKKFDLENIQCLSKVKFLWVLFVNKIGQGIIQFGFLNLVGIPRKDDYSSF